MREEIERGGDEGEGNGAGNGRWMLRMKKQGWRRRVKVRGVDGEGDGDQRGMERGDGRGWRRGGGEDVERDR